ncbi:polysaccharide biosynthesis/export family protein [Chenggangzhangella methanolivorans]|nr:polysaccharide biosynthesis/export family protein [Chenggangzhangella methanolivorans]
MRLDLQRRSRRHRPAGRLLIALAIGAIAAPAEADPRDYRLGPGDVLQVGVYGQPELSGKFRVGPDGTLSYPLIGAVTAGGLTTEEVTESLRSRLSQRIPVRSAPSVEVAEFAPVFVTGVVEKPGQYPYRPGMIALELVALAGGERRAAAASETRALQLIAAEQAVETRMLSLFASRAQKARLEAEISAGDFSPDVRALAVGLSIDPDEARKMLLNEIDLFTVRRKVISNQIAALRDQRANFDREMDTLRAAKKLHDGEILLLEQETANAQKLLDKALGLLPTLLSLKRQLSATRRDALEIVSYLARAQQQQLEIDKKIQDVEDQQKKENAAALRDVELAIAQGERGVQSDARAVAEIRSALGGDALEPAPITYRVARLVDGVYTDIKVGDYTELAPRDILRADRSVGAPGAAVTRTSRRGPDAQTTAYQATADRSPGAPRAD